MSSKTFFFNSFIHMCIHCLSRTGSAWKQAMVERTGAGVSGEKSPKQSCLLIMKKKLRLSNIKVDSPQIIINMHLVQTAV
jgi:hypothetical protein